jgi:shikimate kinase
MATGGGTLENPDLMALAREKAVTIFLYLRIDSMLKRIHRIANIRPLLRGKTDAEIVEMYDRRTRFYELCMHHIDTEGLTPEQVADRIMALV